MYDISVTLLVSKFDISNLDTTLQPENIPLILITSPVFSFETSNEVRISQSPNI